MRVSLPEAKSIKAQFVVLGEDRVAAFFSELAVYQKDNPGVCRGYLLSSR